MAKVKKNGKLLVLMAIVSIVFFAAIVCVPLCKFDVTADGTFEHVGTIYGFNALFGGFANRFAGSSIIFASVISWMIFSVFTILLVMLILAVTAFKRTKAKNILLFIVISVATFFALMYFISGISVLSKVKAYYASEAHTRIVGYNSYYGRWIYDTYYVSVATKNATTLAFLPLIVQLPCLVFGLLSFIKAVKSTPKTQLVTVVKAGSVDGTRHIEEKRNTVEELKKLKELLDIGVITQEEFDAKKKELLGL